MKKCISCGKELEDNAAVCPQCGAKFADVVGEKVRENSSQINNGGVKPANNQGQPSVVPAVPGNQKPPVEQRVQQPVQQPVQRPVQQTVQRPAQQRQEQQPPQQQQDFAKRPLEKPVSTAGFFLTMILFAIPIIGWIACIVMSFTAKNSNRRNFARAWLIWLVIFLLLAVAGIVWYSIWGKDSIGMTFSFENRTFTL